MDAITGPGAVTAAAGRAAAELAVALSPSEVTGTREEWAMAVGELQRVIDVASAAQDAAIVRLAAVEPEWAEDGTLLERHRALGHVALDAPAIVSGALTISSVHAERRVLSAVRWAADGPAGTPTATGLGGLHSAMAAGHLDPYRALVVAEELEEAPADVAAGVVWTLEAYFATDDAPSLRRRCRRVLARVSPDLLRQRARRARAESGLRRWVGQPGVDHWEGTFPSEEAARAWAAIDALAQRYVADGTCEAIERARAKALTDLVEGNATIETVVTLAVPDEPDEPNERGVPDERNEHGVPDEPNEHGVPDEPEVADNGADDDLVEVSGLRPGEPVLVARGWLARAVASTSVGRDGRGRPRIMRCDRRTGAPVDPSDDLSTDAYRPGRRLAAHVRARDGRCRFPGCHVSARFADLDHVRPWPAGPTAAANLISLCRRHHRTKQRPGWQVALALDGTATWVDPTGRVRVTHPVDALHGLVLPSRSGEPPVAPTRHRLVLADGPHSMLEHALEHVLAERWEPPRCTVEVRDLRGRGWYLPDAPKHHRGRASHRPSATDPPPF
ncbi:MAG TPA: HNH endonuclease signature motif containing protein [Phycicoccus sp.]|nr:HNH endonuclease signature motif containing protein [Phycicoccus sp.]